MASSKTVLQVIPIVEADMLIDKAYTCTCRSSMRVQAKMILSRDFEKNEWNEWFI